MDSLSETARKAQELAQNHFHYSLCPWQIEIVEALVDTTNDVVATAATGAGKTATIIIPPLMNKDEITIVISPLNFLTAQTAEVCTKLGLSSVCLTEDTCSETLLKDIAAGRYSVVSLSPEQIMSQKFNAIFESKKFLQRLIRIVIDEAHVLLSWLDFRPAYTALEHLRCRKPTMRFYFVSATLTVPEIETIRQRFRIPSTTLTVLRRNNDRPLMSLIVCEMKFAIGSFLDLAFVLGEKPGERPPPFCIFVNTLAEARDSIVALRRMLPLEMSSKLRWVTATTSKSYRDWIVGAVTTGEVWGFAATDIASMGLDINNISVIVQWRLTPKLLSLLQRFGRSGRQSGMGSKCYLMTEQGTMTDNRKRGGKRRQAAGDQGSSKRPDNSLNSVKVEIMENFEPNDSVVMQATNFEEDLPKKTIKVNGEEAEQAIVNFCQTKKCRRRILDEHYDHDKLSIPEPHCDRCNVVAPQEECGNCDICSPLLLNNLEVNTQDRPKKRKAIKKEEHSPDDPLRIDLISWRHETYHSTYNGSMFTPQILLDDFLTDRILTLAKDGIIRTLPDFRGVLDWAFMGEHGGEILGLMHKHHPPHATKGPTEPSTKKAPKCSACKQEGHIKSNRSCPNYFKTYPDKALKATTGAPTKENNVPNVRARSGVQLAGPSTPLVTRSPSNQPVPPNVDEQISSRGHEEDERPKLSPSFVFQQPFDGI